MSEPIDAVFTWVDGSDPEHQNKRQLYSSDGSLSGTHQHAASATRFSDQGELFYSILLARKNAPWLRHIYIITDAQVPAWLTPDMASSLDVHVVDHKVLFRDYENYLPIFNSMSIEAMIHRIPELSSRFLYFNDDFFIVRPVVESDYFVQGQSVFRGQWRWNSRVLKRVRKIARKLTNKKAPARADGLVGKRAEADMMGLWRYFALAHVPHPIYRDDFAQLMTDELIKDTVKFRFRNDKQIWPIGYYANYFTAKRRTRLLHNDWNYIDPSFLSSADDSNLLIENQTQKHLCIQSMDKLPVDVRENLLKQLDEMISSPEPMRAPN
ncbi:MAG: hypothetical protein EA345_14115 [Halomonas sp.]|nr:stealth family protein [Halomonas sp.]TVP45511.1 MAG: hypothetical protein EA345_14115 [Halomonas sp.]